MTKTLQRIGLSLAILLAASGAALAGTTGNILGTVTDAQGGVMPGVTVEVSSPALQGTKVAVSGGDGGYRFSFLPPGTYKVTATLSGFASRERAGVKVGLDDSVRVDFTLQPAAAAEITVSEETPLIDTRSTKVGGNFSEELFESLPIQRDYTSIVDITPGASPDDGSGAQTFYGSSGPENSYIIDGVNTTSVAFGVKGKNLNFDFIKEVEVKTGGYEAEFGRATGGIINVITKTGGNEFHGDAFVYASPEKLQAAACDTCITRTQQDEEYEEGDFGGDLGGYVVRDRIWFFGAFNPTLRNEDTLAPGSTANPALTQYLPRAGENVRTRERTRYYFSGKGTFNLNSSNNLVVSAFGDPEEQTRRGTLGEDATDGKLRSGGTDLTAKINSVLNPSLYFDGQVARHNERDDDEPLTGDFDAVLFSHRATGITRHGRGSWENNDISRNGLRGNFTAFAGDHELKFGVDYENNRYAALRAVTGGHAYSIRGTSVRDFQFFQGFDADGNPIVNDRASHEATTVSNNLALFVQDKWSLLPNLIVSAGLRYEKQTVKDFEGITRIDLNKNFAPRFGMTWDPTNQGKWKVYGSVGRFFEVIPLDLNNRALGAEGILQTFYARTTRDPVINFGPDDVGDLLFAVPLGGEITPVDEDLKGQHLDEVVGGVEYQILPKLAIGVKGIYREIGDVIEDVSVDDGNHYFIANPGQGSAVSGIDSEGRALTFPVPERTFKGFELTANKRLGSRWQLFASYLWGKLEGNYEGLFTQANGQLDPNITSAFDIPSLLPNRIGPLPQDRRHTVKLDGSYETPFGLNVGASFRFLSGTPLNTLAGHPVYGLDEAFILPRGQVFSQDVVDRLWAEQGIFEATGIEAPEARSSTDNLFSFDLSLSYALRFGSSTVNLYADIFNLFNFQRPTEYDETFTQDSADVVALLEQGLSPEQIAEQFTLWPFYLHPTDHQTPRRARFGAKYSF